MKRVLYLTAAFLAQAFGLPQALKDNFRDNFGTKRFILIDAAQFETSEFETIFQRGEFDRVGREGNSYSFVVENYIATELEESGVAFIDRTSEFVANSLALDSKICDPDAGEDCFSDFHATYQTSATIFNRFEQLNSQHSNTAWKVIGETHEGREIKAFEIGHGSGKQVVLYTCAVHAREWITPMFCVHMAEQLLTSSEGAGHLEKYAFSIIPVVNVDGYDYSQTTDNAWRKTRVPNSSARCPGTDANRNFGHCWGGLGASTSQCQETYRGSSAFDQPCTQAVRDYAANFEGEIIHYGDVHSYGEYLLAPQSYTRDLPRADHGEKNAVCYNAFKRNVDPINNQNFKVGVSARVLYEASGVTSDYFYGQMKVLHSYTYEARDGGRGGISGFQPPVENIKLSNNELWVGFSTLVNCIFDSEASNPTPTTNWPEPSSDCPGFNDKKDDGDGDISITVEVNKDSSMNVLLVGFLGLGAGALGMYAFNNKKKGRVEEPVEVKRSL